MADTVPEQEFPSSWEKHDIREALLLKQWTDAMEGDSGFGSGSSPSDGAASPESPGYTYMASPHLLDSSSDSINEDVMTTSEDRPDSDIREFEFIPVYCFYLELSRFFL